MSATTKTSYTSSAGTVSVDALTKQVLGVANQLLALPKFGAEKEPMTATQGSYRPYTSYSGSTHTGCAAVDITAYNWRNRLIVLDLLGIIACHRLTSDGDWPEHMHIMTNGMNACASNALIGQINELMAGGDGLVGTKPDRDAELRSGLWPLAVYQGRTGQIKAKQNTNLRTGPSYDRAVLRPTSTGTIVNAIMEVNVDGDRWFVTDKGEWGFSGKWDKVPWYTPTPTLVPAQVLDLTNWKMTLPIGAGSTPLEVLQPELNTYSHPKWFTTWKNESVVFRCNAGGVTTSGSSYPRSEAREMKNSGATKADWSNASGTHTLAGTLLLNRFTTKKPQMVVAQIHDPDDDVVMIRATKVSSTTAKLEAEWSKGKDQGSEKVLLDSACPIGVKFSYSIVATPDGIVVNYLKPGLSVWKTVKNPWKIVKSHLYFKYGCYLQSNENYDHPDDYGVVVYYALKVTHAA